MSNLNPSSVTPSVTLSPSSLNSLREFNDRLFWLPVDADEEEVERDWKSAWKSFEFFRCHGGVDAEAFNQTINELMRQHNDYSQRRLAYQSPVTLASVLARFQSRLRDRHESMGDELICDDMRELFTLLFNEGHLSIGGEFHDSPCGQFGEFLRLMDEFNALHRYED